jgi:hypothetical protein
MQHVDCLLGRWVICMLYSKFFDDASCFNFVCVKFKELCYRGCLFCCQQTLSQLNFAEVRLIHFGCGSNDSQRQSLGFAKAAEPFP